MVQNLFFNLNVVGKCILCGKNMLKNALKTFIPRIYHKGRYKEVSVVRNETFARMIVDKIHDQIEASDLIIENYPGEGLLTSKLIRNKGSVLAFEPRKEYFQNLQNLDISTSEKLHVVQHHPYYTDTMLLKTEKLQSLMQKLQISDSGKLTVVGVCDTLAVFMARTALQLLQKQGYYSNTRLNIYFIIDGAKYANANPLQNYFKNSFLPSLLFTPECILQFSKIDEIDVPVRDSKVTFDSTYCDKNYWYLIQLHPCMFLYDICEQDRLPGLYYFCQQLCSRKGKERLVIQLEQWCPDIGRNMIKAGYDMMQYPKDLKIQDFIHIYKILAASPHFKDCVFWHMVTEQLKTIHETI